MAHTLTPDEQLQDDLYNAYPELIAPGKDPTMPDMIFSEAEANPRPAAHHHHARPTRPPHIDMRAIREQVNNTSTLFTDQY